ncbi:MAG: FAD-dependent oxidoreductase [Sulfurimonas sp.]|uniref:FAD-dependent oxidoreductase n=1 Tax=Sulfurimonas sp. TaxID=2022749 RepID=UPI0025DB067A|nr:FAD-dependent oxidoreductase [Sulfurimonas sp.]MCK9491586.1 FAD-dependent oxidoreductase [Sulfurimonas sp.]
MRSDVLIIGAGGAGLVAAINAHTQGAKVKVITKEYPTRSQTCMAQGGINAALGNASQDSVQAHIENTLMSARGIANEDAVRLLCESAPEAVEWLDSIGVCFSRTKDAKIAQRTLGGASAARACYAQDYTGLKILHTLYDRCNALGIEMLNERCLVNLVTKKPQKEDAYIGGATFLNIRSGEVETYEASSVIVATGGYSRIYDKHSTNSTSSTGDGLAAAIRAGARLSDMEFVQFHPTALKGSSILISESARGAGGYLLNSKGERFTNELAPRDEVARAIDMEIQKGENVFLDIRHLGEEFINSELPQERKLAKLYENIDPVYDLIPIKPVAHYTMGGIEVDEDSSTKIKGLYAVGECANHRVHGANRLGGNSLLELVVFGRQAGVNAAKYAKIFDKTIDTDEQTQSDKNLVEEVKKFTNQIDFYEKRAFIGNIFYNNAGISRNDRDLKEALCQIHQIQKELPLMGPKDKTKAYNTNLVEFIEFSNMLELCEIVIVCAINRSESRGAHYRSDIPEQNDVDYKAHTITYKEANLLYADFVE